MTKSYQFRALFFKNGAMQSRQMGLNLCQMVTPLLCVLFIRLIQEVAFDKFKGYNFTLDFPYIFNVPALYSAIPSQLNLNCLEWFYYDTSDLSAKEKSFIGWNAGQSNSSGLWNHILTRPGCSYTENNTKKQVKVPYFIENSDIDKDIYNQIQYLNTLPFVRGTDLRDLSLIPDGAFTFHEANKHKINVTIQVNDMRLPEYHRSNGFTKIRFRQQADHNLTNTLMLVAEGQMAMIDLISRSYLNTLNPDVWLISGVQYMPLIGQDYSFIMKLMNVIGAMLYPLALSLLMPVFLYSIVLEKEERLIQMMKMNGMAMRDYWIMQYIFSGLMSALTLTLFVLVGYYLNLSLFRNTNPSLLAIIMTGWGLVQISMSIFFQVFISKARIATIVGYLLSVWTSILALTVNLAIYPDPYILPWFLQLVPQIAFSRLIYVLSLQCVQSACATDLLQLSTEVQGCIISLYVGFLFFGILGIYLHQVVPQEFGTSEPWFFRWFQTHQTIIEESDPNQVSVHEAEEDFDSQREREFVHQIHDFTQYPLICRDLRKSYGTNVAVKNFSLKVEKGEIFGLLGPNGAGKTSLISVLTGLYGCEGEAWIAGFNVNTQMKEVQQRIGVCPQFDLLWPQLTVEEHLLFYARLKGVHKDLEKARVQQSMAEVRLEPFFNYCASQLSGGMKRRLSIAIALVGEPEIIFLDEPSTGLDPENRRGVWEIIGQFKGRKSLILTTHSMEEADVLCSRVGIISQGVLRCIGAQTHLKTLYGGGYHLFINLHRDKHLLELMMKEQSYYQDKIKQSIQLMLPKAVLVSEFNGNFIYQVPLTGLVVSTLFARINSMKEELQIADWGISQSTLEDVFLRVVESKQS